MVCTLNSHPPLPHTIYPCTHAFTCALNSVAGNDFPQFPHGNSTTGAESGTGGAGAATGGGAATAGGADTGAIGAVFTVFVAAPFKPTALVPILW